MRILVCVIGSHTITDESIQKFSDYFVLDWYKYEDQYFDDEVWFGQENEYVDAVMEMLKKRTDPMLHQILMNENSNNYKIINIPDDVQYDIVYDEIYGEYIVEKHRIWR